MTQPTPIQAAEAYFAAWNEHDIDQAFSVFAANGTFWDNQMKAPVPVNTLGDGFRGLLELISNLKFSVKSVTETTNGSSLAEWVMSETKADGTQVAIPGIDVFDVVNGEIIAARAYMNHAPLERV